MVEVIVTDEFQDWYVDLNETDSGAVYEAVEELKARGVVLGFPQSSAILGGRYALRELRTQSQGRAIRVLYAFDPKRQAVLLMGADKTGDDRFYDWAVPKAERLWEAYLEETK